MRLFEFWVSLELWTLIRENSTREVAREARWVHLSANQWIKRHRELVRKEGEWRGRKKREGGSKEGGRVRRREGGKKREGGRGDEGGVEEEREGGKGVGWREGRNVKWESREHSEIKVSS